MKILLIAIFSLISVMSLAADKDYTRGEGRFYAKDEDSLAFVKKQLLNRAFRDIWTNEMKEMGLDQTLFWEKFEEKFSNYFFDMQEKLKEKHMDDDGVIKNQAKYNKELRKLRLKHYARFGGIHKAITSYVIKKMSRSSKYPNSRYISLSAKVDKMYINKVYNRFVAIQDFAKYQTLYLNLKFHLSGLTWNEIGGTFEHDFSKVILQQWKEWLSSHFTTMVERVVIVDHELEREITKKIKKGYHVSSQLETLQKNLTPGEEGEGKLMSNSLFMNVKIDMNKGASNSVLATKTILFSGSYELIDMDYADFVTGGTFFESKERFSAKDEVRLASEIATKVRQIPLGKWKLVNQREIVSERNKGMVYLKIQNVHALPQALSIKKMLTQLGVTLFLKPSLSEYHAGVVQMKLRFQGDQKKLVDFLKTLQGKKVGDSVLSIPDPDSPLIFDLKQATQTI